MKDKAALTALAERVQTAQDHAHILATPTFLVDGKCCPPARRPWLSSTPPSSRCSNELRPDMRNRREELAVRFQRLRLAGFKSFVEATEFAIEPGLTGIVGPNGCGKSNLLEAPALGHGRQPPPRPCGPTAWTM